MKLSPRDAAAFLAKPDLSRIGILIYGPDAERVAQRRRTLSQNVVGPNGVTDMRLERLNGAELRSDPAKLSDAMKAQSFFPGPRAVVVEDATDGLAKGIAPALADWRQGDAFLIFSAGQLTAKSALRKLFEGAPNALALAIYDDPPGRAEIEMVIEKAGLRVAGETLSDLTARGRMMAEGDFAQLLEKLSLYKRNDASALSVEEVAMLAPQTSDGEVDALVAAVANGSVPQIGPAMMRLTAQGTNPTTLCIGMTRHFRMLHTAAGLGGRPEEALGRMRPPVFGPRRDAMAAQIRGWGMQRLERALTQLTDTDLALRSSSRTPQEAMLERAFIRIAMMRPHN